MDGSEDEVEAAGLGCSLERFAEAEEVLALVRGPAEEVPALVRGLGDAAQEREYERLRYVMGLYKEQPHLVHPHLAEILGALVSRARGAADHRVFRYMHLVINLVGYKVAVQHLPHSVTDLVPVLTELEAQDPGDTSTWETRYSLILWLSIVVKIPFHLSKLDYSEGSDHITISERIISLIKTYLLERDSARSAAAVLCAHFFTRADIRDKYLESFLTWACETVRSQEPGLDDIGVLSGVAAILKLSKREDVLPYVPKLLEQLLSTWKDKPFRLSRKFAVKVIQRIGLAFLKPRVLSWRYKRGCRSITENLIKMKEGCQEKRDEEVEDEGIEVPEEIEEVMEDLIEALKDADLSVRWCGAKGVGRVAGRLNQELGDEVVGSVVDLLGPGRGENSWHGGCLALAELSKRGLLLPARLPDVVPLVIKGLTYDEPRGFASVGAIVRDAACYVAWAFARAYETHVFKPYVNDLANALVIVACFDREINIRRAASAAFQEHIGRQGAFPHGIEILTAADYYSVAVRQNSYLNISVFVAQFREYSTSLIDHLVDRKLEHWDAAIRELASKALHNLTPRSPQYMQEIVLRTLFQKTTSIDVNARHGAILSLGEVIHALSSLNMELETDVEASVKDLVKNIRERHQFRGLNGELMKTASCHFIYKCSLSSLSFANHPVLGDWQELIDECLCHEMSSLRSKAALALSAMAKQYYLNDEELSKNLILKYTGKLESREELVRLGSILALGSLPPDMLKLSSDDVIRGLIKCSRITPSTEKWVESRKEALMALSRICESMGRENRTYLEDVFECFIRGLEDYTMDDRGDTGAWVREAALGGIRSVLLGSGVDTGIPSDRITKCLGLVCGQAVQRIDRTRYLASRVFISLVHSDLPIPHRPELLEIFPDADVQPESWSTSYEMLDRFVLVMPLTSYSYHLLEGFVISIGGLTESLVKHSSRALFTWLSGQGTDEQDRVCRIALDILEKNPCEDRILQPMAGFLEQLLSNGCVAPVLRSTSLSQDVLRLVKASYSNSTLKYKLMACVSIYCQLLQVEGAASRTACSRLMLLLCHRLGWVRRSTASALYEALLLYGDNLSSEESVEQALSVLSETDWATFPVLELRPLRNRVALALGVQPPVPVTCATPK